MKKALMPILWVMGAIVVLLAAMYFYEKKWGTEGPFENTHTHDGKECTDPSHRQH